MNNEFESELEILNPDAESHEEDNFGLLCATVLKENATGQKLLEKLRDKFVDISIFPCPKHMYESYGGSLGWAAYCEGGASVIHAIDIAIKNYQKPQPTTKD